MPIHITTEGQERFDDNMGMLAEAFAHTVRRSA